MAAKRRAVFGVDYKELNNLSSVVLYDVKPPKSRKTLWELFLVERIISKRIVKKDNEYLIKWEGWPMESCTWEPSSHLTDDLLRGYDTPPKPDLSRLHTASRQFYSAVQSSLKSRSISPTYINMELDVWRYISHGKGVESEHRGFRLYSIEDLRPLPMPDHWWYYLNIAHGQGQVVKPPLKIKPVLSWTAASPKVEQGKLVQALRMPIEKLCVDILRRPCDNNNV